MLIICDIPALRLHAEFGVKLTPLSRDGSIDPTLTCEDLAAIDLDAFQRRYGQVHAIVGTFDERRNLSGTITHMCSAEIPASSVCEVKRGVCVASVALTVVLMSRKMSDYRLVRLLYEVCATYRLPNYLTKYRPLTDVGSMMRELAELSHIRGSSRVQQLLAYVADNSASPRETDLAMLAWLPCRLGGYGLPMGKMNKVKQFGDTTRKCDLWFEDAKLGIEYESDESHSGKDEIVRDSARRTFLGNKGCKIVTMTNGEFKDDALSHETMRFVGKLLGKRIREPHGRNAAARKELLAFVRSPHLAFF